MNSIELGLLKDFMDMLERIATGVERIADANEAYLKLEAGTDDGEG